MCIWLISVDPEPLFFSVIFVDISPIKNVLVFIADKYYCHRIETYLANKIKLL